MIFYIDCLQSVHRSSKARQQKAGQVVTTGPAKEGGKPCFRLVNQQFNLVPSRQTTLPAMDGMMVPLKDFNETRSHRWSRLSSWLEIHEPRGKEFLKQLHYYSWFKNTYRNPWFCCLNHHLWRCNRFIPMIPYCIQTYPNASIPGKHPICPLAIPRFCKIGPKFLNQTYSW